MISVSDMTETDKGALRQQEGRREDKGCVDAAPTEKRLAWLGLNNAASSLQLGGGKREDGAALCPLAWLGI